VALSRRLRTKLRDLWIAKGQPDDSERILPNLQPQNYAARHFAKVCEAARLDGRTPKDLRNTFASQLLTAGVQLGYVSKQLGHSDVSVPLGITPSGSMTMPIDGRWKWERARFLRT
jgi:integrase